MIKRKPPAPIDSLEVIEDFIVMIAIAVLIFLLALSMSVLVIWLLDNHQGFY